MRRTKMTRDDLHEAIHGLGPSGSLKGPPSEFDMIAQDARLYDALTRFMDGIAAQHETMMQDPDFDGSPPTSEDAGTILHDIIDTWLAGYTSNANW